MKKILLAATFFLCVNSTFASETAILKIKGTLTSSACTPEFSNGGVVDYGNIRLGELSSTTVNQLGQRNIDLTITCTAATKVAWNMIDDRADSNAGLTVSAGTFTGGAQSAINQTYGVGKAGTVNIGSYAMFMKVNSITADGKSVDPIYQQNGSSTWAKSTDGSSQGENNRNITVALSGTVDPLAFQTATFPLVTSLAIQNTATLAITDDTRLDGQLTISLKYL
ncbi:MULTISPECIES: DUF1120 domain-containing protein [Enterobacter cloacae complex]|uniref:DUF1120 domain-containing protein n=1 Tax=Enterobacter cloacae TaxID=550 RepID=A0A7H8UDC7_ENTCL|nr:MULTISPECIES: DUF1120 domain-containing protein [Enterobacter cloacae complex]MDE4082391.1 DUF1120 domain-containing protein [Enterobacter pasteurii]QKZ97549.1 DUF1120 domain-containing protein [Enterobacter cloacae]